MPSAMEYGFMENNRLIITMELKSCKFILTFIFGMGLLTASSQTPSSVFITAGQSNAEGRAASADKPAYLDKGYKHLRYAFVRSTQDGKFGKYKFGDTFAFCDVTNYFIDKAIGKDFYSIKCTYGGTSVTPGQYNKDEAGWKPVWYADSTWLANNKAHNSTDGGLSLVLSLTEGFAKCVEQSLGKLKNGYEVKAIMWHQGESDRNKPEEYYNNFKDMITSMREQIYSVTGREKDKTLPFVFGTVPHASRQYNPVIEAAQLRVAKELPNVYPIDFSDIPLKEDVLHFNSVGTEYAGKQMFNKLVELGLVEAKGLAIDNPSDDSQIAKSLTIFRPLKPNGKAIVICPGGGYEHLAIEHEGTDVARWLADKGYLCAVLKYRFPNGQCTLPSDDSRRAIRFVRRNAEKFGIFPDFIGIMGFSAGGHLAATTATLSDAQSRPDFQILMYPVISMSPEITHWGSRNNLLGKNASTLLVERYSLEENVDKDTPPAIIILAGDDNVVNPENSIRYYKALRKNDVPASMFIYPEGGHGWGMRDSFGYKKQWMQELEKWLENLHWK